MKDCMQNEFTKKPEESLTDHMERMAANLLAIVPEDMRKALGEACNHLCMPVEMMFANPNTRHHALVLATMIAARLVPLQEAFAEEFDKVNQ